MQLFIINQGGSKLDRSLICHLSRMLGVFWLVCIQGIVFQSVLWNLKEFSKEFP